MTAKTAISVAAMTAMPAPCGVGTRWEERALGFASACRSISGRTAQVRADDNSTARMAAANDKYGSEWFIDAVLKMAENYFGTSIGASPWAAFSGLKIHTSPPKMPTRNVTAPNSSDMLTPSLAISPA